MEPSAPCAPPPYTEYPQQGYPPQPSYPPQQGYPAQPPQQGYPPQPGYPSQQGYTNNEFQSAPTFDYQNKQLPPSNDKQAPYPPQQGPPPNYGQPSPGYNQPPGGPGFSQPNSPGYAQPVGQVVYPQAVAVPVVSPNLVIVQTQGNCPQCRVGNMHVSIPCWAIAMMILMIFLFWPLAFIFCCIHERRCTHCHHSTTECC